MQQEIRTEIIIESTSKMVYEILTDLESYEKWNPFIIKSEGQAKAGNTIKNTMRNGSQNMVFKPKVLKAENMNTFEWLGCLYFRGLFDGHHYFHIEEIDNNRVNLIHGEKFSGVLSRMILRKIRQQTLENFKEMNRALKSLAESKTQKP